MAAAEGLTAACHLPEGWDVSRQEDYESPSCRPSGRRAPARAPSAVLCAACPLSLGYGLSLVPTGTEAELAAAAPPVGAGEGLPGGAQPYPAARGLCSPGLVVFRGGQDGSVIRRKLAALGNVRAGLS